ncbi:MAG: flagellar assembly peptidoglycan hydrolase FlgJ [Cellvibrionaceae bacterium]
MNQLPTEFNRFQTQQSYTDLNQLNDIRKIGNEDQSLALKKIAQQFESMFMQMMLKSMRSANDVFAKDNPLNSFEMGFHRDMLDNQMSLSLSQGNQLGLADALYRQLNRNYGSDSALTGSIKPLRDENGMTDSQRLIKNNPYQESVDTIQQRSADAAGLNKIKSPEDFIKFITPYAKEAAEKIGVDYKVIVAQSALETGWGEHSIRDRYGNHSFNLFNIKADSRWDGHLVNVATIEYKNGVAQKESANFRRYDTIAESFNDYQEFLNQPRYQKALLAVNNSEDFVAELQHAGYATDPNYAKKINQIVEQHFNNSSE